MLYRLWLVVRVCRTCHVVNVILDNKPEAVGLILVLLNICGGVRFAHGDGFEDGIYGEI